MSPSGERGDHRRGVPTIVEDGAEGVRLIEDLSAVQRYSRSSVETGEGAAAVVDRGGAITEVNDQMLALTGRGRDELVGAPLRVCFGEANLAEAGVRQAFVDGSVADIGLAVRHRDGGQLVVSCSASKLHGNSSAPGRVLVVAREVTEHQDRLLALASLVQSSHDAIVGKTLNGVITSWNPGAEHLYGYTGEEVIGRSFEMVLASSAGAPEAELLRQIAAGQQVEPYEAERRHKDGTVVTVSVAISPITDSAGRIVGVASISRDLRERKRVEAKFRWMLEVAPDAILGVDASGSIELVNAQCERLFGYRRDELMGQQVEVLVPTGVRPVHAGHRARYDLTPTPRQMGAGLELTGLHKDGTEIPVEISLSALEASGEKLTMAAVRDVTDRRRFERQLREQNVELERASLAKNNFLASMSHELRTPLNAIIGFTGTILMKLAGPLTAKQDRQLRLVQNNGKHLLSIINDLLDLAKIESGQVQVTLEPVDCRSVADEVVQGLQPLADDKSIVLSVEATDVPVVATSDRRALGQILINLVNNAIKFTDSGEVSVRLARPDGGGMLRIAVRDTGPGIPREDLARIFRAFERSATTAKSSDEGTGLGLHISQRLAELLGATITVSSVLGEGSTFTVSLPLAGQ